MPQLLTCVSRIADVKTSCVNRSCQRLETSPPRKGWPLQAGLLAASGRDRDVYDELTNTSDRASRKWVGHSRSGDGQRQVRRLGRPLGNPRHERVRRPGRGDGQNRRHALARASDRPYAMHVGVHAVGTGRVNGGRKETLTVVAANCISRAAVLCRCRARAGPDFLSRNRPARASRLRARTDHSDCRRRQARASVPLRQVRLRYCAARLIPVRRGHYAFPATAQAPALSSSHLAPPSPLQRALFRLCSWPRVVRAHVTRLLSVVAVPRDIAAPVATPAVRMPATHTLSARRVISRPSLHDWPIPHISAYNPPQPTDLTHAVVTRQLGLRLPRAKLTRTVRRAVVRGSGLGANSHR
jgi:hypothetical protein